MHLARVGEQRFEFLFDGPRLPSGQQEAHAAPVESSQTLQVIGHPAHQVAGHRRRQRQLGIFPVLEIVEARQVFVDFPETGVEVGDGHRVLRLAAVCEGMPNHVEVAVRLLAVVDLRQIQQAVKRRRLKGGVDAGLVDQPLPELAHALDFAQGFDQKLQRFAGLLERLEVGALAQNFFENAFGIAHANGF